ncbi:type II toxin-antitoxin system YafQ family toxin [Helicobacter sp. 11S02596-1]|uniref:type II toxin-antitoxin system YafQ family toxin n=1 Tax=Helicobacter sp. 11S02596-1 TaxID=1476194 RepID=UPI000BA52470|nr:type II toxin-antitoxin system YafQ family toxin [Helicobacter sp. 11S02596-1]PAF43625.1 addiction module toxin RelE [Helicobacter sp. 11S02596-1]
MSKYKIFYSKRFKKDLKKLSLADIELLSEILDRLANDETLELKYRDHPLKGGFLGHRDCHIKPDLVLIYQKCENDLILNALRISSHSELF